MFSNVLKCIFLPTKLENNAFINLNKTENMKILILIAFCVISLLSQGQSLINFGQHSQLYNVVTTSDHQGNFYILGQRVLKHLPLVYENQQSVDTLDLAMLNQNDNRVHLIKLDENGNLLWTKKWDYTGYYAKWNLSIDQEASVVLSTLMRDSIDLDPSLGEDLRFAGINHPYQIVLKLDESGEYLWGHSTEQGNLVSYVYSTVDESNAVYCVGSFNGTLDVAFGNTELLVECEDTTLNGNDIYLEKISPNGTIEWVKTIGQSGVMNYPTFIASRQNGFSVYGSFTGDSLDVNSSSGHFYLTNPSPFDYYSAFELNYNQDGVLDNWDIVYSSNGIVELYDQTVGENQDKYMLGTAIGIIYSINGNFPASNTNGNGNIILKRNAAGQIEWMNHYNNSLYWAGLTFTDRLNVAGSFMGVVDFDASSGVYEEYYYGTPNSNKTTFLMELEEDGSFYKLHRTQSPAQTAFDITSNLNGRLMMIEYFEDSLTNFPANIGNEMLMSDIPSNAVYIWENSILSLSEYNTDQITLFPNPTKEFLTINSSTNQTINEIKILDLSGKNVLQKTDLNTTEETISISQLSSGVYQLIITFQEGYQVAKIVKE